MILTHSARELLFKSLDTSVPSVARCVPRTHLLPNEVGQLALASTGAQHKVLADNISLSAGRPAEVVQASMRKWEKVGVMVYYIGTYEGAQETTIAGCAYFVTGHEYTRHLP